MLFLFFEEKGHALFYQENKCAATMTMKLQLFTTYTITNVINTIVRNLSTAVKEMWILSGVIAEKN